MAFLTRVSNQTFTRTKVDLDGKRHERCRFIDCEICYSGMPAEVSECYFERPRWSLSGPAAVTVFVLRGQCGWWIQDPDKSERVELTLPME